MTNDVARCRLTNAVDHLVYGVPYEFEVTAGEERVWHDAEYRPAEDERRRFVESMLGLFERALAPALADRLFPSDTPTERAVVDDATFAELERDMQFKQLRWLSRVGDFVLSAPTHGSVGFGIKPWPEIKVIDMKMARTRLPLPPPRNAGEQYLRDRFRL